jgi:hypothetical protein
VWVVEANLDQILLASNALGPIRIRKKRRRSSQKKIPQEHCKFVFFNSPIFCRFRGDADSEDKNLLNF